MQAILKSAFCLAASSWCVADEPVAFQTGKALDKSLSVPVSMSSTNALLQEQLTQLQQEWRIAIIRDRRTDPQRRVTVKTGLMPRVQVLNQISREVPASSLTRAGDVLFLGPQETAHRLPVLMSFHRDRLNTLRRSIPPAAMRTLTAPRRVMWSRPAEPRQILLDAARSAGAGIDNIDAVPWDVWDTTVLPPMTFADVSALVLHQFDLTLEVGADVSTLRIVPVADVPAFESRHAVPRSHRAAIEERLAAEFPRLAYNVSGSQLTATATMEEHAEIERLLFQFALETAGAEAIPSSLKSRLFALGKTQATVGDLIQAFRDQGIAIDVPDEDSPEVQAALRGVIRMDAMTEKTSGREFFPHVFGDHFSQVDVQDNRVVLGNPE